MNRHAAKILLTAALMTGVLGWFAREHRPSTAGQVEESGPELIVWQMLEASGAADTQSYLVCYTGEMEQALRRNVEEMGTEQFGAYLANTHDEIKGVALAPADFVSPLEARIRVEYVYVDRNEMQLMYLRQIVGEWRIFRADSTEPVKTLIPYGTPVAE